jgi:predicted transcriptional regulator
MKKPSLLAASDTRVAVAFTRSRRAAAVPLDSAVPDSDKRALLMLKLIAQGERDIARGRTVKQRDVFRAARKRLSSSASE